MIWKRTRVSPWLLVPLLVLLLQSLSTSCARACKNGGCIARAPVRTTEREGRAESSASAKAVLAVAKTILPDSASNALCASGLAFAGCHRPEDGDRSLRNHA